MALLRALLCASALASSRVVAAAALPPQVLAEMRAANATLRAFPEPNTYPCQGTVGVFGWGKPVVAGQHAWCEGFLPGILWQLYNVTSAAGDASASWWLAAALARTAPLAVEANCTTTHDVGFMVFTSFGAQAQLTDDPAARAVVLTAAASLATRWMPAVGMLRSWGEPNANHTAQVIVDTLMNLELLFWAGAAEGGNATLTALARAHADRTAADFFQPWTVEAGCCWHLVEYNDTDGALLSRTSRGGGLGADTVWTQGLAWAVAGYALAFRYTREPAYLAQSAAAADCFLAGMAATGSGSPPLYGEPLWDFNASSSSSPGLVVDSSAGAIAAAGLAELASHSTAPGARARYAGAAHALLDAAAAHWAYAPGEDGGGATLRNGTLLPDVGVPTSWGEYYSLLAAMRLATLE